MPTAYQQLPLLDDKRCGGCERDLPRSAFYRRARALDGLQAYCKDCSRAAVKRHQHADPVAYADYHRGWRERNPGKAAAANRRLYHRDRAAGVARVMAWRSANHARVREYDRLWRQVNGKNTEYTRRRAARHFGAVRIPFTPQQLAAKLAYWGDRCWRCHGPVEAVDHVKPLAKGGPHCLANLRPICNSCNSRKRDRWPL